MNVPVLRFSEFSGEWDVKKLKELAENGFSNGVFNDPNKVGTGYKLINVLDMYIETSIDENKLKLVAISESEFLKNKVKNGDIFFTRSSLVKEGIACSNIYLGSSDDVTFDGHLIKISPEKNLINPIFFNYVLRTSKLRKQLVMGGKTTTMTTIGQADIAPVKVPFPLLPEQQKIADFLTQIDNKINQLSQKKQLLERYKKGVMQQIFSQAIRFKDDDGREFPEWEERNFGDIFSFRTTNSFSRENLNYENGFVKNIHYGDIHTKFSMQFDITKEQVPFVNSEIELKRVPEDNYCKSGDLIITDASEDYADIGKCIEVVNLNNEKVLAGLHTILARPDLYKMYVGFSRLVSTIKNNQLAR